MESRILMMYHTQLPTNQETWSWIILRIFLTTLVLCPLCNAQCSIPPPNLTPSTTTNYLYSPNYPDQYPDNTACSWLITSPLETGRIQIKVTQQNLACCCKTEYLIFKDGSNSSAQDIAILCDSKNPVTLTSSGAALYGEFRSDGDGETGLGYTLEFSYFDSNKSCPPGWVDRVGFCYRRYDDELLNWQDAASRCGYDNGFLTSIASPEENEFLLYTFGTGLDDPTWIGLDPNDAAGSWLDGSDYTYNSLQSSTPGGGQCVTINLNGGRWDTGDCSTQQFPFICKKSKDGSGGRYLTMIDTPDEGGSSYPGWVTPLLVFAIFFLLSFVCSNKNNRDDMWCCLCKCIAELFRGIFNCIRSLCECACGRVGAIFRPSTRNGEPSTTPEPIEVEQPSVNGNTGMTSEVRDGRRSEDPPPSYEDTTALPPPPSYVEALELTFDLSADTTDVQTVSSVSHIHLDSQNSHNINAAPSYESVVTIDSSV